MMMLPYAIFGAIFSFLANSSYPGIVGVNKNVVKKFFVFMLWVTLFRIVMLKFTPFPTDHINQDVIGRISPLMTLGVFWEDAAFTLPLLIMERMGIHRFFVILAMMLSSVVFAYGHLAYGPLWAFITLFYVPFISYRIGKKHGLGTVMAGHVLYDLITILTLKALL